MELSFYEIEDADWDIILKEIRDKEHPLRELELLRSDDDDGDDDDQAIKPGFTEFAKTIGAHTTLVKLKFHISSVEKDVQSAVLLKALKDNRTIKHLSVNSEDFDSKTAHTLAEMLMNNQTLVSLNISVCSSFDQDYA
jgi:hypothetical protein